MLDDREVMSRPSRRLPFWAATRKAFGRGRMVFLVLGLLGLACAAGLAVVCASDPRPNTFTYELAKALLQLLTVIVIGGGLSLVTFNYQSERDDRRESQLKARDDQRDLQERSDAVLRDLLREALESYHAVKRARRFLRARRVGAADGEYIDVEAYEEQLAVINDVQLDFERLQLVAGLVRDVRVDAQKLVKEFETIQKYLSELLTEWEQTRRNTKAASTLSLRDLEKLYAFMDEGRRYVFRSGVADRIKTIVAQLQGALVVPLPTPQALAP